MVVVVVVIVAVVVVVGGGGSGSRAEDVVGVVVVIVVVAKRVVVVVGGGTVHWGPIAFWLPPPPARNHTPRHPSHPRPPTPRPAVCVGRGWANSCGAVRARESIGRQSGRHFVAKCLGKCA